MKNNYAQSIGLTCHNKKDINTQKIIVVIINQSYNYNLIILDYIITHKVFEFYILKNKLPRVKIKRAV